LLEALWHALVEIFSHPLGWLSLSAPLILAAMGGFTSERSGVINIALEGKMLTAACAAYVATVLSHNAWLALGVGIGSAIAISLIHWLLTQTYRLDHIISGMAINALAFGLTNYLHFKYNNPDAEALQTLPTGFFWTIAVLLPFALFLFARYTRGGLRLFAVGNDPDKSRLMGVQPLRVRLFGLVATGVFTGIAGTMMFTTAGTFTEGMTAGRGFIALAALILGGWRPLPALGACAAF
jgi:simple sugar transport system permease protein